ncbi:MAG: aminotransferase class V-fold PLP-dependent enzyme [Anaerolineae bacterium]|nr:aminotransferase class V-fold PLP-dependent enzyme [Anaerolineae bacterium]
MKPDFPSPFQVLFRRAEAALQVYSNVHRGMGHFSLASTALYERARREVLRYFGASPRRHVAIFGSPSRLARIMEDAGAADCRQVCAADLGLAMGVCALVLPRHSLPKGTPGETGGGIVQLVTETGVIWHQGAERFEVGTPPIFPAILLGIALQMIRETGDPLLFLRREPACAWEDILARDEFSGLQGQALLSALTPSLVGHDVLVPTAGGLHTYVNLDGAASTPTFRPIWQAYCEALIQPVAAQAALVRQGEEILRDFFHAPAAQYDFVFACNASEALNFAARCLAAEDFEEIEPVVVNSLLDHHSNELPWRYQAGMCLVRMDVNQDGYYDLDNLASLLKAYNLDHSHGRQRIVLVAVNGASNVLGTFNDLTKLSTLCHHYDARILVDGAQLSAHKAVDMLESGIDYYAFSAHKMYSPFGSGGLFLRKGLLRAEEALCRGGLENAAGVAALAKSLDLLRRIGMEQVRSYESALTRTAVLGMQALEQVSLYGLTDPAGECWADKGPVVSFELNHIPHNLVSRYLAEYGGIGSRTGCFCAHMMVTRMMNIRPWRTRLAYFLLNLGFADILTILPGVVRVSFGIENTPQDVERLLTTLAQLQTQKVSALNRWLASVHEGTWFFPHSKTMRSIRAFVDERVRMVFPH